MKSILILLLTISFSLLVLSLSNGLTNISVFADDPTGLVSDLSPLIAPKTGTFKITDIGALASTILSWGLIAASLMVLIFLVWGGIQWMASGGDKNALEAAKGRLTATIFGAALVVSVWAIFIIIKNVLGLPILGGGNPSTPDGTTPDGSTKTPWSCTTQMCDCCNATNKPDCCKAMGKYAGRCIVGRYRNSDAECAQLTIDWNICWANEEYSKVSDAARKEIAEKCK